MAIEVHEITSREQWLELRKSYITASVIGAMPLFNCHDFVTPLKIFCEKRGVQFPVDEDNKVLRRGRWLEPAVAKAVSELRPEWELTAPNKFYCDPEIGIGATPDFLIHGDPRGRGIAQTKTVSYSVWRRSWDEGKDIPLWVTLQCLTEMFLTNAKFGIVAVMLVDPHNMDVALLDVPRHAAAEAKIINEVKRFWQDIKNGIEPPVDFERDGAVIKLLLPRERPGSVIDFTGNNELPGLLARRAEMIAEMKHYKKRCEVIENKLRNIIGDAAVATGLEGFNVSYRVEKHKGYTVAPSEPRVLRIKDMRPADQRPQITDEDEEED